MTPPGADYDQLADLYDETRGGERRGDEYAADIDGLLVPDGDPVLEIGAGTGVVALGLVRRGRRVVGVDISVRMLRRAQDRLGAVVGLGDAMELPVRSAALTNAYSVWVLQAVDDARRVVAEAARIVRPGGHYVVCLTQRAAPDDSVGLILEEMGARIQSRSTSPRHVEPSARDICTWAEAVGFGARVESRHRRWSSPPSEALDGIRRRMWAGLRALDDQAIEEVTRPAVDALQALSPEDTARHGVAEILILERL